MLLLEIAIAFTSLGFKSQFQSQFQSQPDLLEIIAFTSLGFKSQFQIFSSGPSGAVFDSAIVSAERKGRCIVASAERQIVNTFSVDLKR